MPKSAADGVRGAEIVPKTPSPDRPPLRAGPRGPESRSGPREIGPTLGPRPGPIGANRGLIGANRGLIGANRGRSKRSKSLGFRQNFGPPGFPGPGLVQRDPVVVCWPSGGFLEAWGTKAKKPQLFKKRLVFGLAAARPKNQFFPEQVWFFGLGTPGLQKTTWPTNHYGIPLN